MVRRQCPELALWTEVVVVLAGVIHCAGVGDGSAGGHFFGSPSALILPQEGVSGPLEERAGDTGNIVGAHSRTGEHNLEVKALVTYADLSAEVHHGPVGIAYGALVLGIYHAVAVKVYVLYVAKGYGAGALRKVRTVVQFLEGVVEAVGLVSVILAD